MTRLDFMAECGKRYIDPEIALENPEIVAVSRSHRRVNPMKPYAVVYDSPRFIDRYTVVIVYGRKRQDFYSMNDAPFHPQGFNQYVGSWPKYVRGHHLGKRLNYIPASIMAAIKDRMRD